MAWVIVVHQLKTYPLVYHWLMLESTVAKTQVTHSIVSAMRSKANPINLHASVNKRLCLKKTITKKKNQLLSILQITWARVDLTCFHFLHIAIKVVSWCLMKNRWQTRLIMLMKKQENSLLPRELLILCNLKRGPFVTGKGLNLSRFCTREKWWCWFRLHICCELLH